MIRAKDGVGPRWLRMVRSLTFGLSLGGLGCSAVTGLRWVGTDRPTLRSLWDRSRPPAPDPQDDRDAPSLHAAPNRAVAGDEPARRGGVTSAGVVAPPSARRSAAPSTSQPVPDETIRITLGRPEPLPALAAPRAPVPPRAAARSTTPGRPDRPLSDSHWSSAPRRARAPAAGREPGPTRPAAGPKRPARPASQDARTIVSQSEAKLRSLGTYQVKMSRIERVGGRLQPEEEILLSVCRNPKAVRLEWATGPNQGREVIYSSRRDERSLYVHMPKSAIPLPTMKIPVDSPLVMKNSRHSITEAGFDTIIANLRKSLEHKGPGGSGPGELVYQGLDKPPGLDRAGHRFTRRSPAGETWDLFLDARTMLPCLVLAKDSSGQLDERYVYHEVHENPNELASADAFDPDRRWGEPAGWWSRWARAADSPSPNTGPSPPR